MCYHYKPATDTKRIELRFKATPKMPLGDSQMTNGYSYPNMPVILNTSPQLVSLTKWGLVPFFAQDEQEFLKKTNTLNAKIETLESLNSYKNYVENRCLVLAESFKEWKHETVNGKLFKIPYEIKTADNLPFAMAGIYSIRNDIYTFTILTTEANDLMSEIHNTKRRMPVILGQQEETLWLNREPLKPYYDRNETQLVAEHI